MVAIFEIQPNADTFAGSPAPVHLPQSVGESVSQPVRELAPVRRFAPMRAVMVGVVLMAMLLAAVLVASLLSGAAAPVEAAGEFHVVSEGDTLYSVASSWNSQAPVGEVIGQISALNGGIDQVAVGDVIALPAAVR